MEQVDSDIVVIGAGLTGLTIANKLRNENATVTLLEARDRIGGRIYTLYAEDSAPIELGATWIGKQHTALFQLLKELEVDVFEQILGKSAIYEQISLRAPEIVQLPPNNDPSYRIIGGTDTIITALASSLKPEQIRLNQLVSKITLAESGLVVETDKELFKAKKVISTLPPHLFAHHIKVEPGLPQELVDIAKSTHTWMGESIKIALTYATPFWRESGASGTIMSNVGPIPEMYDHSDYEDEHFALKGFFNGSYYSITKEERLELIMNQLERYYGSRARDYIRYAEAVWIKDNFTSVDYESHVLPHQNNGHPIYEHAYLEDRLYIAGTETSAIFGGYMEGAICSAQHVYKNILRE